MLFLRYTIAFLICVSSYAYSKEAASDNLMQNEIKHVVVLMLENRSFDNILAWLYSKENPPEHFIPPDTIPIYEGLSEDTLDQYTNILKNPLHEIVFTCAPIKGVPSCLNSPYLNSPQFDPFEPFPHVKNQIYGFDGSTVPTMNGFLQDYAELWGDSDWRYFKKDICAVMETYTEKELPVIYSLSRHYAVSDMWFSSVPTQTNPNRAFAACGTSEGQTVNGTLGKSTFYADTIWNRLSEEAPDATWAIFWQADMTPVLFPGPMTAPRTYQSMNKIRNVSDHLLKLDNFHTMARNGELPDYSFVEPQWTISMHVEPYIKKYEISTRRESIEAAILGIQGNDLHPPGDVRTAENFLSNIYTSLIANEESWNKTLLVITFDEHGGIFDHVPPPIAIPPDDFNQNGFNFDRFGVRVPAIFISPRINKGTVIRSDDPNIPFDHTSLISTILKWKKIDRSKWRMGKRAAAAPTFEAVITLDTPRTDAVIAPISANEKHVDNAIVHMGEKFYLKNQDGDFFILNSVGYNAYACLGTEQKAVMEFGEGAGRITHGSCIKIKAVDASLGNKNVLIASGWGKCSYEHDGHLTTQWWTIKSADHPYLGSNVHYGDRVYFENHIYLDLFQLVPGRMVKDESIFGKFLTLQAITDKNCNDNFWVIEKCL